MNGSTIIGIVIISLVIIYVIYKITINIMYYKHPLGLFDSEFISCDSNYKPRKENSLYRYEGNNKISYSPNYWKREGGVFKEVNCTGLKLILPST